MRLPLQMLLISAALVLIAADDPKDVAKKDMDKMQGVWDVVSIEIGAEKAPPEELKKFRLTIKDNKMSHQGSKEGETEEATYLLGAGKDPKEIDVTPTKGPDAGKVLLGIYSIDGDNLKLCLNHAGLERPKKFESPKDTKVGLIILKRGK
jgi:uncharacterized protein (TIGR03067 family)